MVTLTRKQQGILATFGLVALALVAIELLFPESPAAALVRIVDTGYLSAALRLTVPIAFAALGGIFAEKSGVINIGLEGLLIISAFTGILTTFYLEGSGSSGLTVGIGALVAMVVLLLVILYLLDVLPVGLVGFAGSIVGSVVAIVAFLGLLTVTVGTAQANVWAAFLMAMLASTLLALIFAVVTIRYKADQIIAGLAVWIVALGFAPFASKVIWGAVNSPSVTTLDDWKIPLLSQIPWAGEVLFNASPPVYMLLVAVPAAWYTLYRTSFGAWVRASGENPRALDTAGVNVTRVRYTSVLLSGALAGIGGAGLALSQVGQFIGSGTTMVAGRGWIGITAYLFGNYNPVGAFGSAFLFSSLDALQIRIQQIQGINLPSSLVQIVPYVAVIVVLALVGRTRIPESAGEHYESGEE